ncbi:MAG: ABC transporter permease [Defluviitaleaceae bacterium]|nr:ABC transporter permease [Defluviitaleaceae bacterium]
MIDTVFTILQRYGDLYIIGLQASLYMIFVSTFFAYIFGLPLGILLIVTEPGSFVPRPVFHSVLGAVINIGRSIPFIILIVALIPFTRAIMGTSLGPGATVVPLVVGATPFVARLVEASLKELDPGVIEAAESMGASLPKLVFGVMLPEALPSLIRGVALTAITLVGYSAMAGAVGGGGLGDIAIRFGYYRYQTDVMLITIVMLVVLVQIIQAFGNLLARVVDKSK